MLTNSSASVSELGKQLAAKRTKIVTVRASSSRFNTLFNIRSKVHGAQQVVSCSFYTSISLEKQDICNHVEPVYTGYSLLTVALFWDSLNRLDSFWKNGSRGKYLDSYIACVDGSVHLLHHRNFYRIDRRGVCTFLSNENCDIRKIFPSKNLPASSHFIKFPLKRLENIYNGLHVSQTMLCRRFKA